MAELGIKRLFLLDMDGTIYLDEALFPGTRPFLETVRAAGGRYLFLTNNSSKSVDAYIAKLARLGIPSRREDFLTSVDALIAHLAARQPRYHRCYVFGTASFRSQLAAMVTKMAITAAYRGVKPIAIMAISTTRGITKWPCSLRTFMASGMFSRDRPDRPSRLASKWTANRSPR